MAKDSPNGWSRAKITREGEKLFGPLWHEAYSETWYEYRTLVKTGNVAKFSLLFTGWVYFLSVSVFVGLGIILVAYLVNGFYLSFAKDHGKKLGALFCEANAIPKRNWNVEALRTKFLLWKFFQEEANKPGNEAFAKAWQPLSLTFLAADKKDKG